MKLSIVNCSDLYTYSPGEAIAKNSTFSPEVSKSVILICAAPGVRVGDMASMRDCLFSGGFFAEEGDPGGGSGMLILGGGVGATPLVHSSGFFSSVGHRIILL